MLPAPNSEQLSLADVMQSCLASIAGRSNRLGLPGVDGAIVLLIDGLGAQSLKARSGHARTMVGAMSGKSVIESGFPTTTAAALASLTTGEPPGQHGLVGYAVLDAQNDRLLNQLSGWDVLSDPLAWQTRPTLFETAVDAGFAAVVVGPERFRDSGFTRAVLRGARYEPAAAIGDRAARAVELLKAGGPKSLIYVYVPELDQAGHAHGQDSVEWTSALESVDAAVHSIQRSLGRRAGMIVTADHGMLDVANTEHVLYDRSPGLVDGLRFVGGEPRCLQLYFEPDASPTQRNRVLDAWRAAESGRSWIVTRREAIEANWFGAVRGEVEPRIGDVLIAARKAIAYYDSRSTDRGRQMIGQHGSWSPAEVRVPLIRFGAFAP